MDKYRDIINTIYSQGSFSIKDFYTREEFNELYGYARTLNSEDIMRNFDHPAYKLAVNEKLKTLLIGIAKEKCNVYAHLTRGKEYVSTKNISISFHRKGPTYGNSSRTVDAYHYDDAFITGVFSFSLPPSSSLGSGVHVYKNLKARLGMRFFAKLCSRALGRLPILRKIFKPDFIPYEVGTFTFFFGDITLHGVENCSAGDRVSMSVQFSQQSLRELKAKFGPDKHRYLEKYV